MNGIKNALKIGIAGLALACWSHAMASGFQDGIPPDWTCEGACGTSGADGVVTLSPAADSSAYGWVATRNNSPTGLALEGVGGTGQPTTGSRLRSSEFSANAGDALEFYFNYVTSDGAGFADYAWARLLDSSLNQVALLFTARTTPAGNTVPGFGMPPIAAAIDPAVVLIVGGAPVWSPLGDSTNRCFDVGCGYTGWVRSNYSIPSSGNFVLEFGVVNWNDGAFQSGLAFDGITVGGVPIGPVTAAVAIPMMSPLGLAILSAMLLGGLFASRKRG